MPERANLLGKRFTRLLVIADAGSISGGSAWLCKCDCGKKIVVRYRYLVAGETTSCKCSQRAMISFKKLAEKNPNWKGDKVGYDALHEWVQKRFPKSEFCQDCKKVPPLDLANISQEYKRDLSDWEWLCRRCHMLKDGRLKKFIKSPKGKEVQ